MDINTKGNGMPERTMSVEDHILHARQLRAEWIAEFSGRVAARIVAILRRPLPSLRRLAHG